MGHGSGHEQDQTSKAQGCAEQRRRFAVPAERAVIAR